MSDPMQSPTVVASATERLAAVRKKAIDAARDHNGFVHIDVIDAIDALLSAHRDVLAENESGLDPEKAVISASLSGGYTDPEFVADQIRDEHTRYDTYGFLAALDAQHRAIVGALRSFNARWQEDANKAWEENRVLRARVAEVDGLVREVQQSLTAKSIASTQPNEAEFFAACARYSKALEMVATYPLGPEAL